MITILLFAVVVSGYEPTSWNCSAPPYWVAPDGRDLMQESHGRVTMVFLLRFDCPGGNPCTRLVGGFRTFTEMIGNSDRFRHPTNYIIIAPPSDRPRIVEYWKRSLTTEASRRTGSGTSNKIEVIQDDREGRIWKVLGGKEYDMFVYDRCGRQAFYVPYPQSSFKYHYPVSVINKAHIGDPPCGACPPEQLQRRYTPEFPQRVQTRPAVAPTTTPRIRVFFAKFGATLRRADKDEKSIEVVTTSTTETSSVGGSSKASTTTGKSDLDGAAEASTKKFTTMVSPDGSEIPATIPGVGEEGAEVVGEIDSVEGAEKSTEVVVPAKTTTTAMPTTTTPYSFRIPGVDCSSFSDHKCWAQQSSGEELHPCCYKGVYMTDICKEPRCNENTYNLCCFQRLQQARYRCCQNTSVTCKRPDEFSRCCYELFTEDADSCCPSEIAKSHWSGSSRAVEYCLPNVVADWQGSISFTVEGENHEIDLTDSHSLAFRCNHLDRFPSCKPYYYIPYLPIDDETMLDL